MALDSHRNEITFSYFDEPSGTYQEVTVPGNVNLHTLFAAFRRFATSLGHNQSEVEGLNSAAAFPCCGQFETCKRACVHRGYRMAQDEQKQREQISTERLKALFPASFWSRQ